MADALTTKTIKKIERHARKLEKFHRAMLKQGLLSQVEFDIRSSIIALVIDPAVNVNQKLKCYQDLARYEGMLVNRAKQTMREISDMSVKEMFFEAFKEYKLAGFAEFRDFDEWKTVEDKKRRKRLADGDDGTELLEDGDGEIEVEVW